MKKRLVLAGGGHGHLLTLKNIRRITSKGIEAILISPSEFHYYSGMGPGMLGGIYEPNEIRFNVRKMAEKGGAIFIRDRVISLNPEERHLILESGRKIKYDAVSFNVGSSVCRGIEGVQQHSDVFMAKPVESLFFARQRILELGTSGGLSIAVAGGGPAACEIAANVLSFCLGQGIVSPDINIYCDRFMPGFNGLFKKIISKNLRSKGIGITEGFKVTGFEKGLIKSSEGMAIKADIVFMATGVSPPDLFKISGLSVGPDGGLSVNKYLQSVDHPEIFGTGDCIHFKDKPLDKAGVYAVRQAPVLLNNLMSFLEGKDLMPFKKTGDYLMILNLGFGKGILKKKWLVIPGVLSFILKDYIDRNFMNRFR